MSKFLFSHSGVDYYEPELENRFDKGRGAHVRAVFEIINAALGAHFLSYSRAKKQQWLQDAINAANLLPQKPVEYVEQCAAKGEFVDVTKWATNYANRVTEFWDNAQTDNTTVEIPKGR